jgi:hypothetical protein
LAVKVSTLSTGFQLLVAVSQLKARMLPFSRKTLAVLPELPGMPSRWSRVA